MLFVVRRDSAWIILPGWANLAIGDCLSELHHLGERIDQRSALHRWLRTT